MKKKRIEGDAAVNNSASIENPGEISDISLNDAFPELKAHKRKKGKKIIISLIVVVVLIGGAYLGIKYISANQPSASAALYSTCLAEKRDINVMLSGSGTLAAADSYTVTSLLSGEILSAAFEEGDTVAKDTVLYEIDSSDVETSIEKAQNALEQSEDTYSQSLNSKDDLNIKATASGKIAELNVEAGDAVTVGETVAVIRNSSVMCLTLPFSTDDAASFKIGQTAEVTLDSSFETLSGTISKISATEDVISGNMPVKNVTIDVPNPGGISSGQSATAIIGAAACSSSGTFTYKEETSVVSTVAGDVEKINVIEGNLVSKNQVLITLKSDTVDSSIDSAASSVKSAELSLEDANNQLDDYTIKSPISGTIIEKHYKQGDTLESGETLCTIFDLSYLTLTLNIDELDISQVEIGQTVSLTADAVEGKTYEGTVTKININGTTTNGVTSYPVTIRIDETEGLLPGMSVDAEIYVETLENVLTVPVDAVARDNLVLVKTDDAVAATATDTDIPAGFKYAEVTLGGSDEDYIEITSGLSEGDTIAILDTSAEAATDSMAMYEDSSSGDEKSSENGSGSDSGSSSNSEE